MDKPILRKKSKGKLYISLVSLSVLSFITVYIFSDSSNLRVDKSSINIKTVQKGPFEVFVIGNGTVVPRDIDYLIPKSSGEVESVNVESGDRVQKGQVLFVVENEELLLELGNREIALAEAKSAHDSKVFELETQKLELERAMLQARSAFSVQEEEYMAEKSLFEKDNPPISKLKFRQSEIKARELEAVYKLEVIRLKKFSESMKSQLHQYKAQVKLAENILERINGRIGDLELKAKRDGVIQDVEIKPGQQVAIGDVLGLVYDPSEVYVRLSVSAVQGHRLKIGQEAVVMVSSEEHLGNVVRIDPNVKGTTIDVDVELPSAESLRSNMFVSGKIVVEKLDSALFVQAPPNSVENGMSSFYLLTDKGNYAEKVKVSTGFLAAGLIQIKDGLSEGDTVVVSGSERFESSSRVKFN